MKSVTWPCDNCGNTGHVTEFVDGKFKMTPCPIRNPEKLNSFELLLKQNDQLNSTAERLQKAGALLELAKGDFARLKKAEAQIATMQGILRECLPNIELQAEMIGYGLYNPSDPRDFTPDPESCTENELARWKDDCRKVDAGEPVEHAGPIGWGLGTYIIRDPRMIDLRDRIKQVLSELEDRQ